MSLDWELWQQLRILDGGFIDDAERELFVYYVQHPSAILAEMATVRGSSVVTEKCLPFSFFFSPKGAVRGVHRIHAKITWNPIKISSHDADGYMELHGNYDYVIGSHKYKPTAQELSTARKFFRQNKVLFSAVWEEELNPEDLQRHFWGDLSWEDLLSQFELKQYDEDSIELYNFFHCRNVQELEQCVRKHKMFNLND